MPNFRKIPWLVFEKNPEQTDGRTHEDEFIVPTSEVGGSNNSNFANYLCIQNVNMQAAILN